MANAGDLKSPGRNPLRVRFPLPASLAQNDLQETAEETERPSAALNYAIIMP